LVFDIALNESYLGFGMDSDIFPHNPSTEKQEVNISFAKTNPSK
jgi:hypothetical protein